MLRPFCREDRDELHALFTDAGVRRWLLDDEVVSLDWVDAEIAASEARFSTLACGLWALRQRTREEIVGFVGFRPFWEPPELELLYGLHPGLWGQGIATDAARAALTYAFEALAFQEVRAATDAPNSASIAVLLRLGFAEWKRTADGPAGTIRFRLSVDRWRDHIGSR